MLFDPPLQSATLIRRYKRFLADVQLADGTETTIHCPNTGAMTGCATPGDTLWYSTSDNPKRKYPFTWELTETSTGDVICVNTARANQITEEALNQGVISELSGYQSIKREVRYGQENSRIDFLLSEGGQPDAYVEVKSVTLLEDGQGYFPDAVTQRGQKHLRELLEMKKQGHRAVLLFAVLHSGINQVRGAAHIDAEYARLLSEVQQAGVEVLACKADISRQELSLRQPL